MTKDQENKIREMFIEFWNEESRYTEQRYLTADTIGIIVDFISARFREMEGETKHISTCKKSLQFQCQCIEFFKHGNCEHQPKEERSECHNAPIVQMSPTGIRVCEECHAPQSKEVSQCCSFCHKVPDDGKCYDKECACHTHPYSVIPNSSKEERLEVSKCCGKEAMQIFPDGYERSGEIVCCRCRKPFIPSQEKECQHPYIENNMMPDTCRDCGKVLKEDNTCCSVCGLARMHNVEHVCDKAGVKKLVEDNKEPWESDFDKKFYWRAVSDNGVSRIEIYLTEGMNPSPKMPSILKSFIRSVEERSYEQGAQEERQFILNILDGIDRADKEMGNDMGGTLAIRHALQSRIIKHHE